MSTKLFDSTVIREARDANEFMANVLESSTEYSIIAKSLDGKILLWNEGAHRMYGYDADEVVGKANSDILHTPEDATVGRPREMMAAALCNGKWEGIVACRRKNGELFRARVVITPRRDALGTAIGYLLISKDISDETRLTEQKSTPFDTRAPIESDIESQRTTDPGGIVGDECDRKRADEQLRESEARF